MIDTLNWGGAQKMQVFLAESLLPLNIDLSVVSMKKGSNASIPDELKGLGVDVQTFHFPRLVSPKSFAQLVHYIQQSKVDLIHAHLSTANIIGTLAGRLTGVPVIASLRSSGLDKRYQRPARVWVENLVVGLGANRIMANGWAVGEFARRRFAHREIDIIPNAIEPVKALSQEDRKSLRQQMVGDDSRPIILSVGRLVPLKGFSDLISAFADLQARFPQCALAVVGAGYQESELSSQIERLNLSGHVFLLGVRNDVSQLMSASDIYVNSSHIEGLPVTVLEAMAAGLPVVATRVGDTPHVVAAGTGILVDPGHPEQIAQALIGLIADPNQQHALGTAALGRIKQEFNRRAWIIKLLKMYQTVTPAAAKVLNAMELA
jgi:glycosyltransferase involved in cell wall biosynthesis